MRTTNKIETPHLVYIQPKTVTVGLNDCEFALVHAWRGTKLYRYCILPSSLQGYRRKFRFDVAPEFPLYIYMYTPGGRGVFYHADALLGYLERLHAGS